MKTMRVSNEHWNVLLDFAEKHPEIITNKFVGASGKQNGLGLWNTLSVLLNSLGFGEKTCDKWKKTGSLKQRKTAKIKMHSGKTGGGRPCALKLSDNEERILSLMGKTAAEGDNGVVEYGVKRKGYSLSSCTEAPTLQIIEESNQREPLPISAQAGSSLINSSIANVNSAFNIENVPIVFEDEIELPKIDNNANLSSIESPSSTKRRRGQQELAEKIQHMNDDTLDEKIAENLNK